MSPQHKVLLQSSKTAYYFGHEEVLASAHSLINGTTIRLDDGLTEVTYRHILLKEHELLMVNGLLSESLYPAARTTDPQVMMEMELAGTAPAKDCGFVRPALKAYEAQLLSA